MAHKRKLPRHFQELTYSDWVEIYNLLDAEDGAKRKIPPDGMGMAYNEKRQSRLSEADWVEIYLSIRTKLTMPSVAGRDKIAREWRAQLRGILRTLDVVRATFIGGKPV